MKTISVLVGLCTWASLSWGADFCVTTSAELQAALTTARDNGEHDMIRVAQGSYPAPVQGFVFAPLPSEDDFDLVLAG
ncbi:MAG: hypothetical protein AAGJ52_09690, partial [Pseudomonadota bacterium]